MMLPLNKKKLENFWYYYKVHVIAAIFVGFLVVITLKDCMSYIEPDVAIAYMDIPLAPAHIDQLKQELAEIVQDANNDGKKEIAFLSIMDERKLLVTTVVREVQIFVLKRELFERQASHGVFQPLDEIIEAYDIDIEKYPEVRLTPREMNEEHIYGIPLEHNRLFKDLGVNASNAYMGIGVSSNKGEQKEITLYKNAYAILEKIMAYSNRDTTTN